MTNTSVLYAATMVISSLFYLTKILPLSAIAVLGLFFIFLVCLEVAETEKESILTTPNFITLLRTCFVIPGVLYATPKILSLIFAAGIFLDFVDGFSARKLKQETKAGGQFDMESDAFTILLTTLKLAQLGQPPFVVALGLWRYAYVLILFSLNLDQQKELRSSKGRIIFLITSLSLILTPYLATPGPLLLGALILLSFSFLSDLKQLIKLRTPIAN